MRQRPPRSPLFPYTTLFRSAVTHAHLRREGHVPTDVEPELAHLKGHSYFLFHPAHRSEEHTSELQSQSNLVCRLLLEKKNTEHTVRQQLRLGARLAARDQCH